MITIVVALAPALARAQVSPWVADSAGVSVPVTPAPTAGSTPPPPAPRDSVATPVGSVPPGPLRERKVKPFLVMARSALVPGWGQVYNRQPLKAVAVVAGEGFLTYKIFQELKRQNDAIDRAAATSDTLEYNAALEDELTHKNRKIDWIWWTAAAHLLQMADAYVNAHFLNFEAEFGPDDDRTGSRSAPRVTLAIRARF